MQRLEVSGAVRPIYGSLGVKRLINPHAKKKSNGVKSGDLGGQAVGPSPPIQRPGKVSSRNVPTFKCTDVDKTKSYSVHCWKHKFHKAFRHLRISMYFCIPLAWTRSIWRKHTYIRKTQELQ